ncbi:MAG: hypothetical protein IJW41_03470 [Oscillospiraceae bacterium]|nr:hypothetical protein [Oscillospiraceae bacterium]
MKKIIALLLVVVMAVSVFAACGKGGENGGETAGNGPASALEILETVWGKYEDADKLFPIMGGDGEDMSMDAPGKIDELENLQYIVYVPAEEIINVDDAATMQHAMNANSFTCGVMHMAEGVDAETFATTMKDTILNNQWMCGFPEKLVVAAIGDYILVAFGLNDAMTPFQTKLAEAYADANVLFIEDIL